MSAAVGTLSVVVCVGAPDGGLVSALDRRAIEGAVDLGRGGAEATVTAVALGSDEALASALRECIAIGADRAIQVDDGGVDVEDPLVVAGCLAEAVEPLRPSLVLCGQRSVRGAHEAVPAALAATLGMPMMGSVVELDLQADGQIELGQKLERGDRWRWRCRPPLVCAVERELNSPRYLARLRLARAGNASVETAAVPAMAIAAAVEERFGPLVREAPTAPRIRPKKTKSPPPTMSAADRMKFLRGGGKPAAADSDDGPQRVKGTPQGAAVEIVRLLEKEELL